jgi:hypothetical protein
MLSKQNEEHHKEMEQLQVQGEYSKKLAEQQQLAAQQTQMTEQFQVSYLGNHSLFNRKEERYWKKKLIH